jgi:MFS family permease
MLPGLRQRFATALGSLPSAYWYLWTGTLINRLGGFVAPFLALYLTGERGLSVSQAGFVVALFGAGSMASGPIGGVLADRLGRRVTLLAGLVFGAASMLALGLARDVGTIAALAFVLGLTADSIRPAVSAMVADVTAPADRARAFGLIYWAVNIGFALSSILAGFMSRLGYFSLFLADAATTLVYAAIVAWRVRETRPENADAVGKAQDSLWVVFRDPVFMAFFALSFLLCVCFEQSRVALPVAMAAHGHSNATFGAVIGLNGVLIVALQPFAARALSRFRRSQVLATSAVLVGFGFGVYTLGSSAAVYALGVALWTLGEIGVATYGMAIVAELAPVHLRGRYQGVFSMSWGLATMVGPVAGSLLADRFGSRALWSACLAAGVLIGAGHLSIAGARQKRLAELEAATPI